MVLKCVALGHHVKSYLDDDDDDDDDYIMRCEKAEIASMGHADGSNGSP